jgi:xanthine dehydrogenase YagR molybdenum-binding subunit
VPLAERTLAAVLAQARSLSMKFDTPATTNPIDQLKVIGKPTDRVDGPLKTTGTAPYAYERHDVAPDQPTATSSAPASPRAASPRWT